MHKKKVQVTDVVDEECLVSGWHHVAGLLVVTVANLFANSRQHNILVCILSCNAPSVSILAPSMLFPDLSPIAFNAPLA